MTIFKEYVTIESDFLGYFLTAAMCRRFPDLFLLSVGNPNGGLILLYLKVRNPILAPPWVYDGEESQRLKWYGYTEARQTRQNLTRQSKTNTVEPCILDQIGHL